MKITDEIIEKHGLNKDEYNKIKDLIENSKIIEIRFIKTKYNL